MLENVLKWSTDSDTTLTVVCRHCWSVQMTMKKNIKLSFQPAQWLSSALATIRRHRWSVQMTMKNNIKWSFQPAQWLSSAVEEDVIRRQTT